MQDQTRLFSVGYKLGSLPRLLNSLDQSILITDLVGQIVYMNHATTTQFGWSLDDLPGGEIDQVVNRPSLIELANNNIARLRQGDTISGDFILQNKDGKEISAIVKTSLIQSEPEMIIVNISAESDHPEFNQLQIANRILTEVDTILGDVYDYEAMLNRLVNFTIPQLGDVCAIHILQTDGSLKCVALAPADVVKNRSIYEWIDNDLRDDEEDGFPAVLQSGETKLVNEVHQASRAAKTGIKSYIILPLITHKKIMGAFTFISTQPNRCFNQNDLELAKNLAINVSIYLEKSRLFMEGQNLKEELETRVRERTTELSEAVARLEQSEEINQLLFRISNKLNATLDVNTILDELAQEAIRMVNGESGFAGLKTDKGVSVKKYFNKGMAIPFEHTWSLGDGIPGWVLKYKVPYGNSDAATDPLMRHDLPINENIRSVICTPILDSQGEVIGFFDIRNKLDAEGFSISDQEMLLTLAPVASIAIQNALAYQQRLQVVAELKESSHLLEDLAARIELTREEERLRISRELHDQLGQALTAMKFDLTSLADKLKGLDGDMAQNARDILTQLNTLIKTVRRISSELRPGMLDDLGLVASIEWQADDFQRRTGIECTVIGAGTDQNLSHEQSLALYRIFQEALTNVVRYANAKHVQINLANDGDGLVFTFHDDGRGIRPQEVTGTQSLGLLGMRERVKHIGGTFEISGVPNQGTTIIVRLPAKQSQP